MPRHTRQPYTCVRCGYNTSNRGHMQKHLYTLKRTCPTTLNDIELTDEIKNHILDCRVYIPKKEDQTPSVINQINHVNHVNQINNTINTYNTINNFIASLDAVQKYETFCKYKDIDIISFEDNVESKYKNDVYRLENNKYKYGYELTTESFFEIVNEVCKKLDDGKLEHLSPLYESKTNQIRIYDGNDWLSYRVNCGIKYILNTIKTCYLDAYECYVIRKILDDKSSLFDKQRYTELLDEYFKFLASVAISPCIDHQSEIDEETKDRFKKRYKEIEAVLPQAEKNKTAKEIKDIIVSTSKQKVDELNKLIANLFKMDEEFRSQLLSMT